MKEKYKDIAVIVFLEVHKKQIFAESSMRK